MPEPELPRALLGLDVVVFGSRRFVSVHGEKPDGRREPRRRERRSCGARDVCHARPRSSSRARARLQIRAREHELLPQIRRREQVFASSHGVEKGRRIGSPVVLCALNTDIASGSQAKYSKTCDGTSTKSAAHRVPERC